MPATRVLSLDEALAAHRSEPPAHYARRMRQEITASIYSDPNLPDGALGKHVRPRPHWMPRADQNETP